MNHKPAYTEYHPRWYRPRMSTWWWMKRGSYLLFIMREISSLFVAWFVLFLLMLIAAIRNGEDSYNRFVEWAASPALVVLNIIALLFVLYHMATWFNLAPQAMVMRFKGQRVPPKWIIISQYVGWAVVTLVLVIVVL